MRRFRIASTSMPKLNGIEFTAEDDATEEEIAETASDAVQEYLSYGWEEVTDDDGEAD